MNANFNSLLREFRENKRISQSDLADMLNCSRAIISSWEDGSALPSRENIIRIGTFLKSTSDEINKLLEAADHPKLSNNEEVEIVNSNMSSLGISFVNKEQLSHFFNVTGTAIGGTSDSLDAKVDSIEKMIGEITGSVMGLKYSQSDNMAAEIEKRLEPVSQQVKSIREEIVPQLEATKGQLIKSDEFIRTHADFFISAVEGEGVIKVITNQIESIEKRLDRTESQINVSKDRVVAIVSVIIAIISACIALFSLAMLIYTSFGK
jgi:transcriptional regulator with XRE-family HTH domain